MTSEDVKIRASRSRALLAFLGSLAFVAGAVALLAIHTDASHMERGARMISAVLGIAFFGLTAAIAAFKTLDPRPAIVLTRDKLINRSSTFQILEVMWTDVAYAEIAPYLNQRLVLVHLKDPDAVLARQTLTVRRVQGANMALIGSPVTIAGSLLACSSEFLLAEINKRISVCSKTSEEAIGPGEIPAL